MSWVVRVPPFHWPRRQGHFWLSFFYWVFSGLVSMPRRLLLALVPFFTYSTFMVFKKLWIMNWTFFCLISFFFWIFGTVLNLYWRLWLHRFLSIFPQFFVCFNTFFHQVLGSFTFTLYVQCQYSSETYFIDLKQVNT